MKIILLILTILLMSSLTFAQWERTNGPEGISIRCLYDFGGTIYAGTATDGIYVSPDDGQSWNSMNSGIETADVSDILYTSEYLFAGTFGGGVYRSVDGGLNWDAPQNTNNIAVTSVVKKDSFLFAGSLEDGVYRSADNGKTWTLKLSVFGMGPVCVSGNTIFASQTNYTYASTDNGESWSDVQDLEGATIFSFYCKDSLILAGGRNKIYKSTDYGSSFTTINISFSFSIVNINDFTYVDTALFMATSYDGVYKSLDDGLTWTPANNGMGPKDARAITASGSSTLIAGTHYVGIYRSTDLGLNWVKSMSGLPAGSSIESMISTNNYIFAGTRDGVYRTADNGELWTKLAGSNDTTNYASVRGLCELNGVVYAGMRIQFNATVYKTTDAGETWIRSGSGLPNNLKFINALAITGNNIIAATEVGVYYSSDEGENWYQANISQQSIPYVAADAGNAYAIVPGAGIYKSIDYGVNWSLSLGSIVDYVRLATIDNYAFAGSFFQGARYTSNSGSSWFVSGGFPPDASIFALNPIGDGMVLAGTDLGPNWIYISYDNGVTYSPFSQGLGEYADAAVFTFNNEFIFAGSDYHGVWRRLNPNVSNVQTSIDLPLTFHLAQNFPNPFNPATTIKYSIPKSGKVKLEVFNMSGQNVATLVNEFKTTGSYKLEFDATDLSSGIYFYKLQTNSFSETKKMIILQ